MFFPPRPRESFDSEADNGVILNIVVACEDLASALRAEALFEQVKRGLGSDFEIQSSFWRFDEMAIPELRERAEAEFARADMIVISHRAETLRCGLPHYLEGILPRKGAHTRALVTLENSDWHGARLSAQYFRNASVAAGVEFFSETEWAANQSSGRSAWPEVSE